MKISLTKLTLLFLAFLLTAPVSHAQRVVFGVRGTNWLANQFGGSEGQGTSYSSFFRVTPELNNVYFADQTGFPDYYYRVVAVNEVQTVTDFGWFARLDWYLRYYHKEKWFVHYSAFRRNLGIRAKVTTEHSSTEDFAFPSTYETNYEYNFNKIRTLMYGHYLGKPRLGQFYALGGLSLATSGPNDDDGLGMTTPSKMNPALRGGVGVRYKGMMLEMFFEQSLSKMQTAAVNEASSTSPAEQWSRYSWFDINLSFDLFSIPIKSRKTAREVEEIRNSW